ncbi:hypothetical protein [Rhodophyticola porphyridii]|uniref:hypothetical protein n=1 Tax=Rhodophyticola porphyridii TaxID=1852017 RepID=UPI0035CECA57
MTLEALLISVGGLLVSALGFLFGRMFAQSERILDIKRDTYRSFLERCPAPNEAHFETTLSEAEVQREIGLMSIYASPEVIKFVGEYFAQFAQSQPLLLNVDQAGHPEFFKVMTSYNRMIWAMRHDALAWSAFAPDRRKREYKPSVPPNSGE